jgi:hypothetical protein
LRFWCAIASFLVLTACSSDRTVLTGAFRFFVPFGDGRGEAGVATITNDRAPLAEGFTVNEEYLALLEPTKPRLLLYTAGGDLLIDRVLDTIVPREGGQRHYLAAPSLGGSVWVASFGSDRNTRGYNLYHVTDERTALESVTFLSAAPYEVQYPNRRESFTPLLKNMFVPDNGNVMLVWHAMVRQTFNARPAEEGVTVNAISIYNVSGRTLTTHRLNFEHFRQTESGDLRFDSVLSAHYMGSTTRFLVEVRYRRSEIRNPFERALFILDTTSDSLERVRLSRRNWNSLLGIARDDALYFIDEVVIHRDTTRAIIGVYYADTGNDMRYAIEANPRRPAMGNFVFSRRGVLYSLEFFERGINFYSWK